MAYMKSNVDYFEPSAVLDTSGKMENNAKLISNSRTQSSGWIFDHQHELLYKLSKKVSLLTGLETFRPTLSDRYEGIEAEAWQVGMYGPGGHYLPHKDALIPENSPVNDYYKGDTWVGDRLIDNKHELPVVISLTGLPH